MSLGKNPNRGGRPAIDRTDTVKLIRIVLEIDRVLILLTDEIFSSDAKYVRLVIRKKVCSSV